MRCTELGLLSAPATACCLGTSLQELNCHSSSAKFTVITLMNIFCSYPKYICVEDSRILLKKIFYFFSFMQRCHTFFINVTKKGEERRQNRSTLEVSRLLIFCQVCSCFQQLKQLLLSCKTSLVDFPKPVLKSQ